MTLGLAVSIGGLLAPAFGALADATSLRETLTVLVVFPLAAMVLALRLAEPRSAAAEGGIRPGSSRPVPGPAGEPFLCRRATATGR